MEKKRPHYALPEIKRLIADPACRLITRVALEGSAALGYDKQSLIDVVLTLQAREFYKSMTTHADHTLWQDVYHACRDVPEPGVKLDLYIKLQVVEGVGVVVSFKQR